ncbi:MAG: DUF4878 domain-containing protein [Pirellulaceae bacterium]
MRTIGNVVFVAAMVMFITVCTGCGGSSTKTPEDTITGFIEAAKEGDVEEARTFVAPEIMKDNIADTVEIEEVVKEVQKAFAEEHESYEIVETSIDGDAARVKVRFTDKESGTDDEVLPLVKIDDKWLIWFIR